MINGCLAVSIEAHVHIVSRYVMDVMIILSYSLLELAYTTNTMYVAIR
jgi:hypothetical protein